MKRNKIITMMIVAAACSAMVLTGCTTDAGDASSSAPITDDTVSSTAPMPETPDINSEMPAPDLMEKWYNKTAPVMDSAMYRGVVSAVTDTGIVVKQLEGTSYGVAEKTFNFNDSTKYGNDGTFKEGDYITAYYGADMTGEGVDPTVAVDAIYVDMLPSADEITFMGEVETVGENSITLKNTAGESSVFEISDLTKARVTLGDLVAGDKVFIHYTTDDKINEDAKGVAVEIARAAE